MVRTEALGTEEKWWISGMWNPNSRTWWPIRFELRERSLEWSFWFMDPNEWESHLLRNAQGVFKEGVMIIVKQWFFYIGSAYKNTQMEICYMKVWTRGGGNGKHSYQWLWSLATTQPRGHIVEYWIVCRNNNYCSGQWQENVFKKGNPILTQGKSPLSHLIGRLR